MNAGEAPVHPANAAGSPGCGLIVTRATAVAEFRPSNAGLPAELAIVVPTFNEILNLEIFVQALERAMADIRWEVVFVDDDSPDGTAREARRLARLDARIRLVHRFGRRGLASACVEGVLSTAAPFVAVMDADMQHDERVLPTMLKRLEVGDLDLVVGSRYVAGGATGDWGRERLAMSRLATWLATRLTRADIADPMSGFFIITRDAFDRALPRLSTIGFKILLDLAASAPEPLRVAEIPYEFRERSRGESKLDTLALWNYLELLLDKLFGRFLPVRMMSFGLVGVFGLVIHFTILMLSLQFISFPKAQAVATFVATTSNFCLNNVLTYQDRRLRGLRLLVGWVTYNLVCGVGVLANVGVARWLFQHHNFWAISALAGIAVTTVWNYAMSSIFTWRKR